MYHITGCTISLDVPYHWMYHITGCTISLDVPYHWMYHITGCTISLDVPYHWMYHITGCTISLDVPYHWMYHITGCTISLDVPSTCSHIHNYTKSNRSQGVKIRPTPTYLLFLCQVFGKVYTSPDFRSISYIHAVYTLPSVPRVYMF